MILKGKKVILRPIKIDDAKRFVKWVNDEEIAKLMGAREKKITLKEEKEWIKNLSKKWRVERHFAIDTTENIHIGSVGLKDIDSKNKKASLGITIGDKNYWGKGYGKDAVKLILDYAFKSLNLHRVDLGVYDFNMRAQKLYKKMGFKIEGVERESIFYKGKFYNKIKMGILRKEWLKK